MKKLKNHFFVCINKRPPGMKQSCGSKEGENALEVFKKLVDAVNKNMLWYEVLVSSSNCLGPCGEGPTIVVYPEGIWYGGVTLDDVDEIVEKHMLGRQPVERLLYEWPEQLQLQKNST